MASRACPSGLSMYWMNFSARSLFFEILEHGERLRPQHRAFLRDREIERRVFLGQPRRYEFAAAHQNVDLARAQRGLARDDLADQLCVRLHLQQHVLDGRQVCLRQFRGLLADRQRRHADDRQIVIVDGDAALVFFVGQRRQGLHVSRVGLLFVVGDRVVAELLCDRVALAVNDGGTIHLHFGKKVGEGQLFLRQRLEQAFFDAARDVDRIDHHHVPVAGLRLLDQCKPRARALELLDIDLDAVGFLEGLQQRRIGMVAPDQRVEFLRQRRRGGEHGECGSG